MNHSCHAYTSVPYVPTLLLAEILMGHVTHMNMSCHIYMPRAYQPILMSHFTHMNKPCHICRPGGGYPPSNLVKAYLAYERVTSHTLTNKWIISHNSREKYVYVYKICVDKYKHTYISCVYTLIYIHVCIYIYISLWLSISLSLHIYIHVYMHVCIYMCIYNIYIRICTYI